MFQEVCGYIPLPVSSFIQWFSTGAILALREHLATSRDISVYDIGDGVGKCCGIQWVKGRAAAKPLAGTGQSQQRIKHYLAPNVNSAEKPCFNSPSPNVNSWPRSREGQWSSIHSRVSYFPGIAVLKVWGQQFSRCGLGAPGQYWQTILFLKQAIRETCFSLFFLKILIFHKNAIFINM